MYMGKCNVCVILMIFVNFDVSKSLSDIFTIFLSSVMNKRLDHNESFTNFP